MGASAEGPLDYARCRLLLQELERILKLIYGEDWQEVFDDIITSWDPEEYFDA